MLRVVTSYRDPRCAKVAYHAIMDGTRTLFKSWDGNFEEAKRLVAAANDAAAKVSGDRDPAPAAAREDDAGDASTVQCENGVAAGDPEPDALDPFEVVDDSMSDINAWLTDATIPETAEKVLDQGECAALYGALWFSMIGQGAFYALSKAAVAKSARRALERRSEAPEPPEDAPIDESPPGAPPGGVLDRADDGPTAEYDQEETR